VQTPAETPTSSNAVVRLFAALPTGRLSKYLVVLAWIALVGAFTPLAGKLGDVEKNDAESWLPGSAESLKAVQLEEQFQTDDIVAAVLVYHRDGGLTEADKAKIETDRQAIQGKYPDSPPGPAIPSDDGQAMIYTVPLAEREDDDEFVENAVDDLRDIVGGGEDGLDIKLTGPAGYTKDLVSVFDGIDGTLLIASASVVAILLLFTYRSPFVWLIPLVSVALAHQFSSGGVYLLAKYLGVTVNGQSGGILPVLVFGAGTDYALLLIARYREELRRHEDKHEAMAFALRQAGPAILASAGTVVIGLLCLLAADLNSNQSLGPVGAAGIAGAVLAMLTLLPAILVIFGRKLFWPFVPRYGYVPHETGSTGWAKIGNWVAGRPRPIWIGTVVVLGAIAFGLFGINTQLPQSEQFRNEPDAILGQALVAESFPAGSAQPAVVIANAGAADTVKRAIEGTEGVAAVEQDGAVNDLVSFAVTLNAAPSTDEAFDTIVRLRESVHAVPDANAVVGGPDATDYDVAEANARDRTVIMPLILVVVFLVLTVLLRALVAPLILIGTVVLSFATALGASVFVFDHLFDFAAVEGSIPLLGFVFLVALGVDYNIFLMGRVHEESARIGTREGMLKGLSVTGGVITSAGLVLAATFSVLGVLPLVMMTELGFVVAFGVLMDTFIVRSILVPALTFDLGKRVWWPSRLAR
jgi:RND superfamily putative drug exporter